MVSIQECNFARMEKSMLSNLVPYLKLLFEYPVLKKSMPFTIAPGSILTNYRLIMNDAQSGKAYYSSE